MVVARVIGIGTKSSYSIWNIFRRQHPEGLVVNWVWGLSRGKVGDAQVPASGDLSDYWGRSWI